MPATLMKTCRTCRFVFEFPARCEMFACPACDALNGRPQAEGSALESLSRATAQRLRCDFHNAVNSYQHVLLDSPEEHEALWGLALCRYGIEYVDDHRTGKRMPTVHSVRRKPMQLDPDYLAALDCAPEDVRVQYEKEAQYIDDAMAKIIELSEKCPPFDVFLCHKTTKPDSEAYTEDYNRAFDLYHELTMQGYRVFFAPKEMAGVAAGSDYEAAIYHALDTAKVMLLICSDANYLTSAWVRSEWTRFLEMVDEREDKRLVPLLYGGFTPVKLPRELRPYRLECVTMDSFTAASNVLRLLEKCCGGRGKVEEKAETVEERPAPVQPKPEKPAPVPENPVTEMKTAPVQSVSTYAPETDFETKIVDGGCSITKYKGQGGQVTIPPTIGGRKVVEIGEKAFYGCSSLTSITLPEGMTSIGYGAFWGCSSLTSITLPDSVTSIEGNAFSCCSSLTSITLPEGVTSIGTWAFDGCSSLTSITLPEGVTSIGSAAFRDCSSLTSITLPDSVTSIEFCAFWGCSSLTSITLPDSVTSIGNYAFEGCSSLTRITLPGGVTSIGKGVFEDCSSLTSIMLPGGVTSIGDCAFKGCSSLTRVTLPPSVKLSRDAFDGCPWQPPRKKLFGIF